MRTSDIFCISSAKGDGPGLFLLESAMFSEMLMSSENLISKNMENLRMEELTHVEELLPYVDMKADNCFTFKPNVMKEVLGDMYISLVDTMRNLSFRDFCSPDIKEKLRVSSSNTPIITYWDNDNGFTLIGVLEDFLRMPGSQDGEFKLHAVFSRHC